MTMRGAARWAAVVLVMCGFAAGASADPTNRRGAAGVRVRAGVTPDRTISLSVTGTGGRAPKVTVISQSRELRKPRALEVTTDGTVSRASWADVREGDLGVIRTE